MQWPLDDERSDSLFGSAMPSSPVNRRLHGRRAVRSAEIRPQGRRTGSEQRAWSVGACHCDRAVIEHVSGADHVSPAGSGVSVSARDDDSSVKRRVQGARHVVHERGEVRRRSWCQLAKPHASFDRSRVLATAHGPRGVDRARRQLAAHRPCRTRWGPLPLAGCAAATAAATHGSAPVAPPRRGCAPRFARSVADSRQRRLAAAACTALSPAKGARASGSPSGRWSP
eukprot:scaffold94607_cov27-Tisochrysis_lutea.AAC.3